MLPRFSLLRPTTVDEAVAALSEERVAYCGGTELLLAMRAGLLRPATLVDIKRIPKLAGVGIEEGNVVIGAATTHRDLAVHPDVVAHLPMLASVEGAVGNVRVRAQGSIGGNLCFAEPKSDVATALMALRAAARLAGPNGVREVSVEDFVQGPYFADREPDELLIDVRVPMVAGRRAVYTKFQTMERPTIGVAVVTEPGTCCVVVGAVGEVPQRWVFADPREVVTEDIAAECDPTPDLTGSERYKRHVTSIYVRRALAALEAV